MTRPKLLDLFCGAGGAGMGYHRAGFDVIGVDNKPHADYPFNLVLDDALRAIDDGIVRAMLDRGVVAAIHASPPCPRYSSATPAANRDRHPDLVGPIRDRLRATGLPYVIENVVGAPLDNPVRLCGSSFGLGVRRHRLFESNMALLAPECDHRSQREVWGVYGDHGDAKPVTRPDGSSRGNKARNVTHAQEVMGIDWMSEWDDLADAIPPAYTEHIGRQLIEQIERAAA